MQSIIEHLRKEESVSSLRIVWEINQKIGRRHTFSEMVRLVRPKLQQAKKLMAEGKIPMKG